MVAYQSKFGRFFFQACRSRANFSAERRSFIFMKLILPLVIACLVSLAFPGTVQAEVAWNNGNVTGVGSNCDFTGSPCPGGDTGWTIFDNFSLSNDDTVIGFSYVSDFSVGSASDYQSTNWSLWSVDPLGPFNFLGPIASGNSVAALTTNDLSVTTYTFTVTGLSVDLPPPHLLAGL